MKLRVQVTSDHIARGFPFADSCPVALALHDAGVTGACVMSHSWCPDPGLPFQRLPNAAVTFIQQFDSHGIVQPFEMDVTVPVTAWRLPA